VHAKDLFFYQRWNGQATEGLGEDLQLPAHSVRVESAPAFIVISSEDEKVVWILDLVGKQQADSSKDCLSRLKKSPRNK